MTIRRREPRGTAAGQGLDAIVRPEAWDHPACFIREGAAQSLGGRRCPEQRLPCLIPDEYARSWPGQKAQVRLRGKPRDQRFEWVGTTRHQRPLL